ncbi:flagellar hook-associated protein FlgK [Methylothermus subterraneus]
MTSPILSIASSALQVTQQALDTTSHNIANVNTQGYSRQRVEAVAREPQFIGAGFLGTGVQTATIQRLYDRFLEAQLQASSANLAEVDQYLRLGAQIDNLIADPDAGLPSALANFFNAVHDVASDPTSIPARQTLLSEAQTLTGRFHSLDARLKAIHRQVFNDLDTTAQTVTALAKQVADLNRRIIAQSGSAPPNDLLDQRDALIQQLAEKVRVSQVVQKNGAVSLFIGNGQALVQDVQAFELRVQPNALNPEQPEVLLVTPATTVTVTKQIQGGEMGGSLRFIGEVLEPTRAKLGRIAAGLALEFNALHRTGFDLDGGTGKDFFTPLTIPVAQTGSGTISVAYANAADLKPSDYLLEYDGSTYTLTRLSDKTQTTLTGFPATVDGLQIDFTSPPTGPSTFLIRPTAEAAANLQPALTDPRDIQAALVDTSGGAIGDNGVALGLAALEASKILLGGRATLQDAYQQMAAEVGTLIRSARIAQGAQDALKQQAIQAREQISGVNLDEEAANLLKFQQAYQAAAHVVSVAQQTFDTLISAIRR